MRPKLFTSVLSFEDALRTVLTAAAPIDRVESTDLLDADGRVAATDVAALIDVPLFDRAAMDGYAVVAGSTQGASAGDPRVLRLAGSVFTGQTPARSIVTGECFEIATGAPLPEGATAVVMVEDTARDGDAVRVFARVADGQNVGRRAADIQEGQHVVSAGDVLTPSRIGALAATGIASVQVYAKPVVAVMSTGNEVVSPGSPLAAGQVYDINQFTLAAVVKRHGGVARRLPVAGDTLADLDAAFDAAADCEIAVFSGGSSVGGRDLMVDALRARGEVLFHGIAVKPGKPTLFGRIGRTVVFGMPGYPTSCLSNAYMLLLPLLRATARLPPWTPRTTTLPLARRISSAPNRHQFYTVRIVDGRAEPAFKASGDITSMAHADGFIEIPIGVDTVEAGTAVTVKFF